MLGVDLSKLFPSTVVFVINIHHLVRHLPGSNTMNFKHLQKGEIFYNSEGLSQQLKVVYLLCIRIVCIQRPKLKFGVSEEDQEVRTVTLLNLLHHSPPCLLVHLVQSYN